MHNSVQFFSYTLPTESNNQTIHIFQIKHIRGILFDDAAEKSKRKPASVQSTSKPQSIHLEIKPVKMSKLTIPSNKKAKDDSIVSYKIPTKESMTSIRMVQQKFDVVARSSNNE